jgi:uncharacterized protein YwqG
LQSWLKEKIKTDFRYLKKQPKWLQSPEWPIGNGKPMVFLGQIDISELSHDNAHSQRQALAGVRISSRNNELNYAFSDAE